jgi:uncharacterized membrane protein YkvA (DUF1232 family)
MKRMSKEDAPGFDMSRIQSDENIVRLGFWRKLHRTAGVIPFSEEAVAAYCCARDSNTPIHVKAIILGALAYFVMPADLIPDIIFGLGYTDDIAVFWAAWRAISRHITNEHRTRAAELLERPSQI